MQFRLTYEGELFSTQEDGRTNQTVPKAQQKHAIRQKFHQQLRRFWETDIILKNATSDIGGNIAAENAPFVIGGGGAASMPLFEAVAQQYCMFGYRWVPLVTEGSRLRCFINVLMLRKDGPASVFSAGDIDNRIKTLVDCLRIPRNKNELAGNGQPQTDEDPFFCLLRDDNLISGFNVETDQLYSYPETAPDTFVKLVIGVDIRPYSVGLDNLHKGIPVGQGAAGRIHEVGQERQTEAFRPMTSDRAIIRKTDNCESCQKKSVKGAIHALVRNLSID